MRHRRRQRVKELQRLDFASWCTWVQERAAAGRRKQDLQRIEQMVEEYARQHPPEGT